MSLKINLQFMYIQAVVTKILEDLIMKKMNTEENYYCFSGDH